MFYDVATLTLLVFSCASVSVEGQGIISKEYPPYNGWFNNRGNPAAGAVDSVLTRRLPAHYQDGVYTPSGWERPNSRTISRNITSGPSGMPSANNKTALFYFFGGHVLQEIVDAGRPGCPPEYFNVAVPSGDPAFDQSGDGSIEIPYQRSRYQTSNSGYSPNHPRDQLNEVTSYLDGDVIYGKEKAWANQLRLFRSTCDNRPSTHIYASQYGTSDCRGELASFNDEGRFPALNTQGLPLNNPVPPTTRNVQSVTRFYQVGGRNVNENPFVFTIDVIWFRHHNWLARQLGSQNPDWSDDKVFNEARIRNIATYQSIVMYEWLPYLLGSCPVVPNPNEVCEGIPSYDGYSPAVPVGITDVFQSAAKHYLLTMAPSGVFTRTKYNSATRDCSFQNAANGPFRVCNTYWNSDNILQQTNIDKLILGMASQIVEKEDHVINEDLRQSFHGPLEFSRRDLIALIIQEGRDHGLPDYNTARYELGLTRRNTWREINPDLLDNNSLLLNSLIATYKDDINNLDVFIGGLLETRDGRPGELFRLVIRDQFVRLRNGDRFWFENTKNGLFNSTQVTSIRNLKFRDVILRTNPTFNSSFDIQDNPFFWETSDSKLFCQQPYQIDGPSHTWSTQCTRLYTYDYFSSSEVAYALVFALIGIFVILTIIFMYFLGKRREKLVRKLRAGVAKKHRISQREQGVDAIIATEILGENKTREIEITFNPVRQIVVNNGQGTRKLRVLELDNVNDLTIIRATGGECMLLRSQKYTHDLVLSFATLEAHDEFFRALITFLSSINVDYNIQESGTDHALLHQANTKEMRDNLLQKFFKAALEQAVKMSVDATAGLTWTHEAAKLINVAISKEEFAEYLKLKVNSVFVEQMFTIADSNDDGTISFREFLDIVVLFTKGSPRDKIRLMFDMYDLDKSGELSPQEFKLMLRSMMEMVNASIDSEQVDKLVNDLMTQYGLKSKQSLTLDHFQLMMGQYSGNLSEATLTVPGHSVPKTNPKNEQTKPEVTYTKSDTKVGPSASRGVERYRMKGSTKLGRAQASIRARMSNEAPLQRRHTVHVRPIPVSEPNHSKSKFEVWLIALQKWNQFYANHIFCVTLYTLITIGVFLQAYFSVSTNHASGLGRIGGAWVGIARASAASLMFNFSTLLLTMSRNTITLLRETFLHRYIPFDSAITMHRVIAWMALLFTVIHIFAHGINFYSISTQPATDLLCLFRDYWYPSNYLPTFVFWAFQTLTGITGIILTLIVIIMYVFASNFSRRMIFNWFQWSHKIGYFSLYFFCVLHGSGALISSPRFYLFFLGPATLYALDKLYSLSRKKVQISVVRAELLPSDVTHLEFKRPANFDYKAGQWVRIACLAQSPAEYHPFTLSSAPQEETLKLHIRAVGPWTSNLRKIYNPETLRDSPYPKLYLDGPFGEGHQDWYKYDVSVLVGGGIGVTPFASILKDLVNVTQSGGNVACKAVYFIWVTRDQKQYEWLTDIIQEVENKDKKMMLNTHIFITQFPHKFDLRTTMLYICEQHFQKIAGKSLFTGLRAITHFGRPDFKHFLGSLADEHSSVKRFGVFSCGPPPMTNSVDRACSALNKYEGPTYSHHFENF